EHRGPSCSRSRQGGGKARIEVRGASSSASVRGHIVRTILYDTRRGAAWLELALLLVDRLKPRARPHGETVRNLRLLPCGVARLKSLGQHALLRVREVDPGVTRFPHPERLVARVFVVRALGLDRSPQHRHPRLNLSSARVLEIPCMRIGGPCEPAAPSER